MKILVVAHALKFGGMERSIFRILEYLKSEGFDTRILLTEDKGEQYSLFAEKFDVNYIKYSKWGSKIHLRNIRKSIIMYNPDFIISFYDKYLQSLLPFLPKEIKVLVTIRNDDPYFYKLVSINEEFVDGYFVNSLKIRNELSGR